MPRVTDWNALRSGIWIFKGSTGELFTCGEADMEIGFPGHSFPSGNIVVRDVCQAAAKCPIDDTVVICGGTIYRIKGSTLTNRHANNNIDVILNVEAAQDQSKVRYERYVAKLNAYMSQPQAAPPAVPVAAPQSAPVPPPTPQSGAAGIWVRGSGAVPPPVPGIGSNYGFTPGDLNHYPNQTVFECVAVSGSDARHYTVGHKYIVFDRHGRNYVIGDDGSELTHIGGMRVIILQCPINVPAPNSQPANPFQQQPVQHAPWDSDPTPDTDEPDNWDRMATGQRPQKERKPYEPDRIDRVENF